jgi:hypothetical protein
MGGYLVNKDAIQLHRRKLIRVLMLELLFLSGGSVIFSTVAPKYAQITHIVFILFDMFSALALYRSVVFLEKRPRFVGGRCINFNEG